VGTYAGAVALAGDTTSILPVSAGRMIHDIDAGSGAVWWATDDGAYVYRGSWPNGRFYRLEHPEGRLDGEVDAVDTHDNEVWWVSPGGVVAYDSEAGEWIEVPPSRPFSPGEATDIAADSINVWVATVGGVWRLIRSERLWHRYGELDGLIDRRVWCVAAEGYEVWFGTAGGISRFDWSQRKIRP
jgi:ligand-binding sensor domain-containing protein